MFKHQYNIKVLLFPVDMLLVQYDISHFYLFFSTNWVVAADAMFVYQASLKNEHILLRTSL